MTVQDEVTLRELAADDRSSDMRGWLQRTHAWLFGIDIFASVASDDALLRIHSTAEEFEGAAEELLVWPQVRSHMPTAHAACHTRHIRWCCYQCRLFLLPICNISLWHLGNAGSMLVAPFVWTAVCLSVCTAL